MSVENNKNKSMFAACEPGRFGDGCIGSCYCSQGGCDAVTGVCRSGGCQEWFVWPTCEEYIRTSHNTRL